MEAILREIGMQDLQPIRKICNLFCQEMQPIFCKICNPILIV